MFLINLMGLEFAIRNDNTVEIDINLHLYETKNV